MKILLLTDSLALPRELPEICKYDSTWPYLLKKAGYKITQLSIGGATSNDLLKQAHYYKSFNPDFVILQVGIVDCTPRFLTRFELNLLKKIPMGKGQIFNLINKPSVRKFRGITYTPLHQFQKKTEEFKSFFSCPVLAIGINVKKSDEYEKLVPGIEKNIIRYNEVLKEVFRDHYIDTSEMNEEHFMSDFHHLTEQGHVYLYDLLRCKLNA